MYDDTHDKLSDKHHAHITKKLWGGSPFAVDHRGPSIKILWWRRIRNRSYFQTNMSVCSWNTTYNMTKKGPKGGAKRVLISIRHKEQQRIKFRRSALPKKKHVDKLEVL